MLISFKYLASFEWVLIVLFTNPLDVFQSVRSLIVKVYCSIEITDYNDNRTDNTVLTYILITLM